MSSKAQKIQAQFKEFKNIDGPDLTRSITSSISVKKSQVKALDQFASDLLSGVKWADFDTNQGGFFAELIAHSFKFVQNRRKKQTKLTIYSPEVQAETLCAYGPFSVIELLNDDMPFLLDSLLSELQARNINIHHVMHPVLNIKRDGKGKLLDVCKPMDQGQDGIITESFISIHVDELSQSQQDELQSVIDDLVGRVKRVVKDWLPMRNRLTNVATCLSTDMPRVPVHRLSESIQFLRWALDNNFTFLGMREYELKGTGKNVKLSPKRGTGLGMLRDPKVKVLRGGKDLTHLSAEVRKFYFSPDPIIVTKANIKSDIHRRGHMDYVGVKLYNDEGALKGELRIVGLFTSSAYASKVSSVPLLRQKLDHVLDHSGCRRDSHTGKALTNIVETFPRDELFQISNELLLEYSGEIQTLDHSPRVKVLKRVDEFDRFVSLLVFLPRNLFSTDNRSVVGDYLADKFHGRVSAFYPYYNDAPYVRIHYIIGRDEGRTPDLDPRGLEADIASLCRRWEDRMMDAFAGSELSAASDDYLARYEKAFPAGYRDVYGIRRLVDDVQIIEGMDEACPTAVSFHHDESFDKGAVEVTLYNIDGPIPLSKRVPIFENLGFSVIDEQSYEVRPAGRDGERLICQHIMKIRTNNGERVDLKKLKAPLIDGFLAVWQGQAENDGFNQLISLLGADWRDVVMLRSFSRYMRQINVPYEQAYIAQVLARYGDVTQMLIDLFHVRFDPAGQKGAKTRETRLTAKIETALAAIPGLDEDQILRSFQNLMNVTLRTNYFQRDEKGELPESLAFKFDSQNVSGAPEPRPFREIFVYSPKVEGVHLRFGKVARGGLRWSDRQQDFRTEVLGLVKAQLVKNTVIVPTGSKGGFVPKDMPENPNREEFMERGIAAYKRFITGLLSITDNLKGKQVIPPVDTVRYDGDDPYLVVAADKGTASFSDIANEISVNHGFWLGDAFASGGSQGYDHKVMGITARGAWEAVKRHFRELDVNIQRQPFTAIGVGDMSGDVFGNGMLLSKTTRLLGAFDHRDIFIDPDPNPKTSWAERQRLFKMGRSSWQDYNQKLISKGGGVFSRSLKSIPLSDEMRVMLDVSDKTMSPSQLMKAILRAKADLLWFGGIGTYVKGENESHSDVGDRANDAIRVTGAELNVAVIGEGANLGITQDGRMDFARHGGRVNTDAVDNSAGVNSSDLEVNIKIALGRAVEAGRLSMAKRNQLLVSMTEDVSKRCLVNNYRQSLTLSLGEQRGLADLGFQQRLMRHLDETGLLNRAIEGLPEDAEINERIEAGQPLSRPELATLLGFAKIDLFNRLIEEKVVDDKHFTPGLVQYFPEGMQKAFGREIRNHPLNREIVATQLTNDIINRGGSTMGLRLLEETGCTHGELASAFTVACSVLGLDEIYQGVDELDNKIKGAQQLALYARLQFFVRRKTGWFIVNGDYKGGLAKEIRFFKSGLAHYMKIAKKAMSQSRQTALLKDIEAMTQQGVPEALAARIADLSLLSNGLDVVLSSRRSSGQIAKLAEIDQAIDEVLKLGALSQATERVPEQDVYDRWALNAVVSRIQAARRALICRIDGNDHSFEDWYKANETALTRVEAAIEEILSGSEIGLSKLIVAVGQVDVLAS